MYQYQVKFMKYDGSIWFADYSVRDLSFELERAAAEGLAILEIKPMFIG